MRKCLLLIVFACALSACSEYKVSDDPTLRLAFSTDTVCFDTVFTEQGSATAQLLVYNPNKNALVIDRVWFDQGTVFRVNIDGEADMAQLRNLTVYGGDSLFVFIRVHINPLHQNNPVLITDALHFTLASGESQQVVLEAYGQDVTRIRTKKGRSDFASYHFKADKPYLIYDTIVTGDLIFDAGARLYMHKNAGIYALGDVTAQGTREQPIVISGDRLDDLFDSVPYRFAAGSWNGIYLQAEGQQHYDLQYMDILSGNVGLYCTSERTGDLPTLNMKGCRIHNHALYGLVLLHTDAEVVNCEISNCASYCVYCQGGTHRFIHSTIASYFGWTNIRIQSVAKEDVAAVYIDNLSKEAPQTVCGFENCIITGSRRDQVVIATPMDQYYPAIWRGNYLKCDTLDIPHATHNVYWQETDTNAVFVNNFYKYKEYIYYDFHPDSVSPARGIGDPDVAASYPKDREGNDRTISPDAGCYQYQP